MRPDAISTVAICYYNQQGDVIVSGLRVSYIPFVGLFLHLKNVVDGRRCCYCDRKMVV